MSINLDSLNDLDKCASGARELRSVFDNRTSEQTRAFFKSIMYVCRLALGLNEHILWVVLRFKIQKGRLGYCVYIIFWFGVDLMISL